MEAADLPRSGGTPSPRLPRSPRKHNSLKKATTPNSKKKAVSSQSRFAILQTEYARRFIQHFACTRPLTILFFLSFAGCKLRSSRL